MRYYLDTEFIEDGKTIDLISIGIIREDGPSLYAQNAECDFIRASDWVWRYVFPNLQHFSMRGHRDCNGKTETRDSGLSRTTFTACDGAEGQCPWRTKREIRDLILGFCKPPEPVEFWGYYCDYDWVVLCQLFGRMIDLPQHFRMYCGDLKQLADSKGVKLYPTNSQHNALMDARWIKEEHERILAGKGSRSD